MRNNELNIAVSTLAFMGLSVDEMIAIAIEKSWMLEFSSGLPHHSTMESIYLHAPIKKIPHNYFPAPKDPFVLNLASVNDGIRSKSINHCLNGLRLAKKANAPFFSAHAGFCIDPQPNELGKKISIDSSFDKTTHWELFIYSINQVLKEAELLNINFLIENNVIAQFNLTLEGKNPLLCCESEDITYLFEQIKNKHLGLLLDTAHLKVSCNTLKKSLNQEMNEITPYIKAIHHSDNDGLTDSNGIISEQYWFKTYMKRFQEIMHIIEVKRISKELVASQMDLLNSFI